MLAHHTVDSFWVFKITHYYGSNFILKCKTGFKAHK